MSEFVVKREEFRGSDKELARADSLEELLGLLEEKSGRGAERRASD